MTNLIDTAIAYRYNVTCEEAAALARVSDDHAYVISGDQLTKLKAGKA